MKFETEKKILFLCVLTSFLVAFMASALNLALPSIEKEFQVSATLLTWIVTGFILSTAAFILPFGRLGDLKGLKPVFIIGTGIYTVSAIFCSFSGDFWFLMGSRLIQGAGAAMIFASSNALLSVSFPPGKRGAVLGINTASIYLGLSLGPVLGGFLTQFGWRTIFLFVSFFGTLAFVLELIWLKASLKEAPKSGRGKFDLFGSLLYGVSIVLIVLGLSNSKYWEYPVLSLFGLILFTAFLVRQSRIKWPLLDLRLFSRNPPFAFSNLAAFINYAATNSMAVLMSLYLQVVKGLPPHISGLILVSQPIVQAVFSPISGRLSDRLEPRVIASLGMGLSGVSLLLFSFMDGSSPMWLVAGNLSLMGLGFGLFAAPNTNAIMNSTRRENYGIASSILGTARLLGQSFSLMAVTFIFSLFLGNSQVSENPSAFLSSFKTAFLFFSALSVVGVFSSLARGTIHNGKESLPSALQEPDSPQDKGEQSRVQD
jgi:EmrB/QacA subfamily drug resistance transporter